ncbi:(Fe-S)-binding protein [Arcticibacterium luteifluviistationis]|uniref:Fe-S oxidoreductase n=1 Tax=Arcticibacterium luteifluviistationis TaxID=1784714 RepID=A0A2Z4GI08_9BACT|nr:(Fe-S)-binding protein [Arcticibacterium luteifluviistationis]AWW00947.1 Fe-S oxidoreductase [Arcticibacterium luteifluviistationis]
MAYLAQIVFILALGTAAYFILRRAFLIKKTIQLGKAENRTDQPAKRFKNMLLIAFGQKKMFERPVVGLLHFLVYVGFILINIEVLEIVIDGIFGTHRVLAQPLGSFYPIVINFFEILAVGVILACVIFLIRRNVLKIERLHPSTSSEMDGWPAMDANIILVFEIALMMAFLKMNAADSILQSRGVGHFAEVNTGNFLISQTLVPILDNFSTGFLVFTERAAWWFHILGIMAFALFVTYSKHLHIALAFPNTYFANLGSRGEMSNMPAVTKEVKIMMELEQPGDETEEVGRFGAKDVEDLSWKSLMDAYSCTECGRCTSQCPANQTGKALSPRKIMMDTRDRLEDIQKGWLKNGYDFKDEKSLNGDYIKEEELLACTTCNACVEACPIQISPLDIILELRRYNVMEESKAPQSWNMMFQNLETSMSPWKFSPDDRFKWVEDMNA